MAAGLRTGSVFITGASRGIGLEFVKQLTQLPEPPKHIFATCRNPDAAADLQALASKNANVHLHKLDVVEYAALPTVVQWVEQTLGDGVGLNVLINNAGSGKGIYAPKEGMDIDVNKDIFKEEVEINALAPLMLTQALLPLLKRAAAMGGPGLSCSRAAVVNITSRMGSIDDNTSGGIYAYRASKAALNMVTKSLSVDLKPLGILATVLHPGWVKTEMGGSDAMIDATTSVGGLLKVMEGLNDEKTGRFITFRGDFLPW